MHIKQIIAVVIVFIIMGVLFFMPVKGLIKKDDAGHSKATVAQSRPAANVDVSKVSSAAKASIGPALSEQIITVEGQLKKTTDDTERLKLQKKLAQLWDDVNQPAPAAFYYQDVAEKENKFDEWLNAGNRFNDAFTRATQDTASQPAFVSNAIACLKNAVKLDSSSLDAKTGLGIAYVNQTSLGITDPDGGSPMQGIMMLLDVVKQDPKNRNANLSLGLFAMKSGQFEKAVQRFKTVIEQRPEAEPYFYLAESYKELGQKKEAIAAYEKCKELMADPAFGQRIDDYIKELKN
ncbi:MAG TPA: tetratricopeptide repeat protein [Mucilaginibacter sp.]|nr:tetratricopeptide repeat protein [Mucilaginibacter sp.]